MDAALPGYKRGGDSMRRGIGRVALESLGQRLIEIPVSHRVPEAGVRGPDVA